jgi:hypothetical protein
MFGFAIKSQTATLKGIIKSADGEPLEGVTVGVKENPNQATFTDEKGFYLLTIDAEKPISVVFFDINFSALTYTLKAKPNDLITYSPTLKFKNNLVEVEVIDNKTRREEVVRLDPLIYNKLPTPTGNIEDIIKTQMGVSSNNELSSGYNVRGGNFDENLVYVNDIEVYIPFLVRSGQQ